MQSALNQLTPLATGLLELTPGLEALEAAGLYPPIEPSLFARWSNGLQTIAHAAGLGLHLEPPLPDQIGGRRGRHSDAFVALLDELTEVYRLEPEAVHLLDAARDRDVPDPDRSREALERLVGCRKPLDGRDVEQRPFLGRNYPDRAFPHFGKGIAGRGIRHFGPADPGHRRGAVNAPGGVN